MFDPRREDRNNPIQPYDSLRPKKFNPYFGSKIRKETQNYENYMKWNGGGVEFRPDVKEDEHGICSPPLWEKQSAPTSPVVHSQLIDNVSLNLSPTSRREALNRGKFELMEMVKAMPESSYELSLKDLVDNFHKAEENVQEECFKQQGAKKIKRKANMGTSASNINENNKGLFLKMVLPLPFGASSKKKVKNPYARVMSKPSTTEEADIERSLKCVDHREWWKKRSSVSDENESGGLSGSSGSSHSSGSTRSHSTRNKNGCLQGFSALYLKKSKSAK
ncbi:Chlorohydroquinone/hydroquinone 1,2-dioxygenase [Heracleum sosnowskyi]|uniref:Chlorohydroquinone/hydroquinone 1,2-dioxygenase n=1 Tax=Heracleum sosnowskyi TaxID=360622 RepID=A0AAD8IEE6_9APIA|nr:Chlorohydroquinone/hydroquinone 1,2-dioxygenase [Heracleum sosnowskyi]